MTHCICVFSQLHQSNHSAALGAGKLRTAEEELRKRYDTDAFVLQQGIIML